MGVEEEVCGGKEEVLGVEKEVCGVKEKILGVEEEVWVVDLSFGILKGELFFAGSYTRFHLFVTISCVSLFGVTLP